MKVIAIEDTIKNVLKAIENGLENIENNEEWLKFLSFQSQFPHYSFNNAFLIYSQKPDAQYVCGFNKWKEMNRYVMKGQKSIRILAPCRYKIEKEEPEANKGGQDIFVIRGFKVVSVFDISQTAGDDSSIPVLIKGLDRSSKDAASIYNMLQTCVVDIPVNEKDTIAAKGFYNIDKKSITVKSSLSSIQKAKTLIHEYAHHLHHTNYYQDESRDVGEIIAESVAYIVSSYLNLDVTDYSIPYIRSWCKDMQQLKTFGSKIQMISSDIICKIPIHGQHVM